MNLEELKIQVEQLNQRLVANNSLYRLKLHESGKLELTDKFGDPTHCSDDEEDRWLDLQDLSGYIDDVIEAELSCQ